MDEPNSQALPYERDVKPVVPISKWAIHRRLYDWVLSFAHHKHSTSALFVLSFTESSFFPIPPDVLLMPLCLGNRKKAFWLATICTLGSVLGGIAGYFIGMGLWEVIGEFALAHLSFLGFTEENFRKVQGAYQANAFLAVFGAAFSPIPYKVFTVLGGVFEISIATLIFASVLGRGMRFYGVASLMYFFGPSIIRFIDRYFNLLTIVFTILLIGGIAAIKLLK